MTTARQVAASRVNGRLSQGPKTAAGKARAAANARRHGLAVPIRSAIPFAADIAAVTRHLAGSNPDADMMSAARRVAEAQVELLHIRAVRRQLGLPLLEDGPDPHTLNELSARARHRAHRAVGDDCEWLEEINLAVADIAQQLGAIDRYERRARSRRQRAINDLDTLRIIEAVGKKAEQHKSDELSETSH
jgi:hypothetical protein